VSFSLQQTPDKAINYCAIVSRDLATEAGGSGPDMPSLESIAAAGAGICTSSPEDIVKDIAGGGSRIVREKQPVWPYLIMLAISLWPVDLLLRRLLS
jgi:hypothetical protein